MSSLQKMLLVNVIGDRHYFFKTSIYKRLF
jgi:hypothetical protein